jgi:chemotaxis protein MotA
MLQLIGSLVVIGCILGGFVAEGGHILALWHPFEILIIVGSAIGAFLISNPMKIVKAAFSGAISLPKGPRYKRADYVTLLQLLYEILVKIRKEGVMAIERDVEAPKDSALFKKYPRVLADHHMVEFITDCLRLIIGGNLDPHELESLLEYELETHHKEAHEPAHAVQKVADALPGFGIVAAVLGIVNTMASLEGADTATIGHRVGAALVGTFLGILMCYGLIGPIAGNMTKQADAHNAYLHTLRVVLLAFLKGLAPILAVEMGRRAIPEHLRPSFDAMEQACKTAASAAPAASPDAGTAGAPTPAPAEA